mgnify:FL=1
MRIKTILAGLLLAIGFTSSFAQKETNIPLDFTLQVKNMHLWRGQEVTSAALGAVDLNIATKNKMFTFGLWGGAGFNGTYREFDYYVKFQKSGFSLEVWDIYNFSKDAGHQNDKIFNYSTRTSGRFIDIAAAYQFQGKFPLKISWATVVFGRDRGVKNEKQLYSTYVSAEYPVLRHNIVNLDLGVAGAFALDKESGTSKNFYGESAGIVNISLTASKVIKIGSYKLPISVTPMWNPENNSGNIQVAINLF